MPPDDGRTPVLTRPAHLVSARALAAEACASMALDLVQSPALWEALHTLGLLLDAAGGSPGSDLAAAVTTVLENAETSAADADEAVGKLHTLDAVARQWASHAHPGRVSAGD